MFGSDAYEKLISKDHIGIPIKDSSYNRSAQDDFRDRIGEIYVLQRRK